MMKACGGESNRGAIVKSNREQTTFFFVFPVRANECDLSPFSLYFPLLLCRAAAAQQASVWPECP
jgi:hypothetical protein